MSKKIFFIFNSISSFVILLIYYYKEFVMYNYEVNVKEKFLFTGLFLIFMSINYFMVKNVKTKKIILYILFFYYIIFTLNILFVDDYFNRHFFLNFYYSQKDIVRNMNLILLFPDTNYMKTHYFENMLLLMPAGYFSFKLFKSFRNPFLYFYVFGITDLCIECIQFVFAIGVFDINDLFMNMLGVTLTFIILKIYYLFKEKKYGNKL